MLSPFIGSNKDKLNEQNEYFHSRTEEDTWAVSEVQHHCSSVQQGLILAEKKLRFSRNLEFYTDFHIFADIKEIHDYRHEESLIKFSLS